MYVIMTMCTYLYLYLCLSIHANAHTQVPAQPWFSASGLTVLIGGVLPFGAVFVEVCLCIYLYACIQFHRLQQTRLQNIALNVDDLVIRKALRGRVDMRLNIHSSQTHTTA